MKTKTEKLTDKTFDRALTEFVGDAILDGVSHAVIFDGLSTSTLSYAITIKALKSIQPDTAKRKASK